MCPLRMLVPVKYVPDTDEIRVDETAGTMVREGTPGTINPLDLYAIEAALQLREKYGGEMVAMSMGPPAAERALRDALALGCHRAFLLSDPDFAGADTWATARTLAAGAEKLGPFDLIICGERATDGETGQVGPELAAMLGLPVVTFVSELCEVEPSANGRPRRVRCRRLTEEGYQEVTVLLPALLTVTKQVTEPRLPTLRGKLAARRAQVAKWSRCNLDLALDECGLRGSPTRVVRVHYPKLSRQAERVEGPRDVVVERIVSFLQTKGFC